MKITIFRFSLILIAINFQNCSGCYKQKLSFPTEDTVSPGMATEIDGIYVMQASTPFIEGARAGYKANKVDMDSLSKKTTCRIDRGRIIVIEDILIKPGSVMVKDIEKVDVNRFRGIRIVPISDSEMYETSTMFYKTEKNGLIEEIEIPKDKKFWEKPLAGSIRYYLLELSHPKASKPAKPKPLPSNDIHEEDKQTPSTTSKDLIKPESAPAPVPKPLAIRRYQGGRPCYVLSIQAFKLEADAKKKVLQLQDNGFKKVGYLLTDDYPKIKGGQGKYYAFIGPFDSEMECKEFNNKHKLNATITYVVK